MQPVEYSDDDLGRGKRMRLKSWRLKSPWTPRGKRRKVKVYVPITPIPEEYEKRFQAWMDNPETNDMLHRTGLSFMNKAWYATLITPSSWTSDEVNN